MIEVEIPGARVAFSTRRGGVSEGPYDSLNLGIQTGDAADRVIENRRLLADRLGLDVGAIATGRQVHGTAIERWGAPPEVSRYGFDDPAADPPEVDGHTTARHGLALLVLVADCLPVALVSHQRVAMIHCGWRGLADGIVEHALTLFDAAPAAVVGPGIGRCCFEVGPEVLARFEDVDGAADGRMLDLRRVAEARLLAAGVTGVEHVDLCTSCHPDLFFSHRRDDGVTGRQCGIVWRP
ncbi:MAG TPA: polyphenol oxidase family protein [Thermoleophilaceae bacterium]|nr:polyphenol oxidase family protein [Thermoleophilaceae bacterium]